MVLDASEISGSEWLMFLMSLLFLPALAGSLFSLVLIFSGKVKTSTTWLVFVASSIVVFYDLGRFILASDDARTSVAFILLVIFVEIAVFIKNRKSINKVRL